MATETEDVMSNVDYDKVHFLAHVWTDFREDFMARVSDLSIVIQTYKLIVYFGLSWVAVSFLIRIYSLF